MNQKQNEEELDLYDSEDGGSTVQTTDGIEDSFSTSIGLQKFRRGKSQIAAPDSTDRKKQTHLRCERQRREAINSGYAELKQLLPSNMSPLGCKTTNASILYRACDHIRQLQNEEQKASEESAQLRAKAMAMRIISQQYEQLAMEQEQVALPGSSATPTSLKFKFFSDLMEKWFQSFDSQVSLENYAQFTRSALIWLENGINFEDVPCSMAASFTT